MSARGRFNRSASRPGHSFQVFFIYSAHGDASFWPKMTQYNQTQLVCFARSTTEKQQREEDPISPAHYSLHQLITSAL